LIFFVDYNAQYPDFNYLEAAPTDGLFASAATTGIWATVKATCGPASDAGCGSASIYTETLAPLATIRGLHRGLFGGQAPTTAIIAKLNVVTLSNPTAAAASNTYAASVADNYTAPSFNGVVKSDYYLPSGREIELMQKNLNDVGLGGFLAAGYWSSSETADSSVIVQYFSNGTLSTNATKGTSFSVRAVRRF
jgi:hypothetical protein